MIEKTVTLVLGITLAALAAAGVQWQLQQLNSALAQRMAVLRLVAERR